MGVPTLEDKIVQSAVAEMLSAIYEVDFLGFSYGFRPGRNPHQALDALRTAIMSRYVNWVLDADIRRFFDSVNHEWLLRMVAHRIADPRVLRPLAAVRFGDIGPPHRPGPVPSRMHPITEVFEVSFQVNCIVLRGNSIDASTRFLSLAME